MRRQSFTKGNELDRSAVRAALEQWLDSIIPAARLHLQYEIAFAEARESGAVSENEFETPEILVRFSGADEGLLLERNAEVLRALEYLAVRSLRLDPPFFDRIRFDAGDFRALRITELKMAAKVAAERVLETRQPFRFSPMAARERRIVHLALQQIAGVRTLSEGAGDERQVVVFPADSPKTR